MIQNYIQMVCLDILKFQSDHIELDGKAAYDKVLSAVPNVLTFYLKEMALQ